jgi:hypothetical protein
VADWINSAENKKKKKRKNTQPMTTRAKSFCCGWTIGTKKETTCFTFNCLADFSSFIIRSLMVMTLVLVGTF